MQISPLLMSSACGLCTHVPKVPIMRHLASSVGRSSPDVSYAPPVGHFLIKSERCPANGGTRSFGTGMYLFSHCKIMLKAWTQGYVQESMRDVTINMLHYITQETRNVRNVCAWWLVCYDKKSSEKYLDCICQITECILLKIAKWTIHINLWYI